MALNIELELTDVNVVLAALGQQPYVQVAEVITKISVQAQEQLKDAPVEEPAEA